MKTKKWPASTILLFSAGLLPLSGWADDGIVRLYGGIGSTNYSIDFDNTTPSNVKKGRTVTSKYTATTFGLTYAHPKGFYVDASAQQSGSAHHDLWNQVTTQQESFSHNSYNLTGGYNRVFEKGANLALFGGYNSGTTTMNAPKGAAIPASLGGGTVGWSKDTFESKGIFFGVGGGFPAIGGRIGVSGAVAYMSGNWFDDNGFTQKADSTFGYSLGANYTYKFTQAFGVTADWKYQLYNYNFNTTSSTTSYGISEKINSVGVRLSLQF